MPDETNAPQPAAPNASPPVEDAGTNSARLKEIRRALDEEESEYQERLVHVRKGLTNLPPVNHAPPAAPSSSRMIRDFLNLFRAPVETFKRVRERLPAAQPVPETAPTNATPVVPPPRPNPSIPIPTNWPRLNAENEFTPSPLKVQPSPPTVAKAWPTMGVDSPGLGGFLDTDASSGLVSAANGQSAAWQSAVAKMQGALEQNSRMSVSVFNQLAEAVTLQNRALEEANRKIEQLNGRIDSLKNR